MIQCVSDWNPADNEPDVIEEAEAWLKRHPEDESGLATCNLEYARCVIEGLLEYIDDNV
jgi:hypothetical protein